MKNKVKIILIILIIALVGVYFFMGGSDRGKDVNEEEVFTEDFSYKNENINFVEIETDFNHNFRDDRFYFQGGTVLDLNNDGKDEVYTTGGENQKDFYFVYEDGLIKNKIDDLKITETDSSYGVTSTDLNNDGMVDLIVARQSGLYIYYYNGSVFEGGKVDISFDTNAIPVDISVGDIDNDGDADMYVSTFIDASIFKSATFNNPANAQNNVMLRNDGDGVFTDITKESGLELRRNTFLSAFVDLNGDEFIDLVVSPNTGRFSVYQNTGNGFELKSEPTGFGFWMGLAISDVDGDGDQDFITSNTGTTIPERLLKGDIRSDQVFSKEYAVILNDGDFNFREETPEVFKDQAFGWGIVAHDFDNDNKNDYLTSHNYIKWPGHKISKSPGSFITFNGQEDAYENIISETGLSNRNYGFSSLVADMDGDLTDEVIFLNVSGPTRFLENKNLQNNRVKVVLPDSTEYQGALFGLTVSDENILKRYNPKQGIETDQSPSFYFSLGNRNSAELKVTKLNGESSSYTIKSGDKILDLR